MATRGKRYLCEPIIIPKRLTSEADSIKYPQEKKINITQVENNIALYFSFINRSEIKQVKVANNDEIIIMLNICKTETLSSIFEEKK